MFDEVWQFILSNLALSIAWLCALLAIIGFESWLKIFGPQKISATELSHLVNKDAGVVFDLRAEKDFSKGHIVNSLNVPVSKLNTVVKEPKYQGKEIILVCVSGQSSLNSAVKLQKLGLKNIKVLKGGMMSWNADSMPVVKS